MRNNVAYTTMSALVIFIMLTFCSPCIAQEMNNAASDADATSSVKIKEVFLIPFTHQDLGFTEAVDTVAMKYKDDIDQAIRLCEEYEEFNCTIEGLWQLEQWLLRSTDEEIAHLKKLIDSQRVEVAATYGTLRSGLLGIEDANRLMYPMQRISERLGITSFDTAIQNDVPGYADVYPRIFASAGVKYFLTGINTGHNGGVNIPRNQMPFLWESSDGQSVLTWIDHDGYISIWQWGIYNIWNPRQGALHNDGKPFLNAIARLEKEGYPYSVFLVNAALGDNRQPKGYAPFIEGVRAWNKAGRKPKIRFATPRQFFSEIERQRGEKKFPVLKGNWHGLWDARLWNPAANILGRQAQQLLPAAESMASFNQIKGIGTYYQYDLIQGFRSLHLHTEHTCAGDPSWIGIFDPTLLKKTPLRQNELTIRFAKDALGTADRIIDVCLSELAEHINAKGAGVVVFNPLQWSRDAIVSCTIPLTQRDKGFSIVDSSTSKNAPFNLEGNGSNLTFLAEDLPAFGYKWFSLEKPEEGIINSGNETVRTWDTVIENKYYRIECDPKTGHIKSIKDLESGREIVDETLGQPMNSLIITGYHDTSKSDAGTLFNTASLVYREKGSFFQRITIERKDSLWPITIITLPNDMKRIDIQHTLDRKRFPNITLEEHSKFYNFVFPFKLNDSNLRIYVDGPDGFYPYPEQYLPGAILGAIQSQYGIHLQEGDQFGVTIANRQAFNWTINEVNFNRKATHVGEPPPLMLRSPNRPLARSVYPLKPLLFSNVVQFATEGWTADYGRTRIREIEPGTDNMMVFDYFITTNQNAFSEVKATRFCREAIVSPLALHSPSWITGKEEAKLPLTRENLFTLKPENVLVTAFKKAEFVSTQDYILRLKEIEGKHTTVKITFKNPVENATLCSINEIPIVSDKALPTEPVEVEIKPFSVATVRLKFKER